VKIFKRKETGAAPTTATFSTGKDPPSREKKIKFLGSSRIEFDRISPNNITRTRSFYFVADVIQSTRTTTDIQDSPEAYKAPYNYKFTPPVYQ
jgi:hypothetical protein